MKITLKTLPISTNQLYATFKGRRLLTRKGRECKEAMGWEAREQYRGEPVEGPLKVKIALWWPTKRNHDVDNIKSLLDAVTGILWQDDGQIVELTIKKGYDKENPRVDLELYTS